MDNSEILEIPKKKSQEPELIVTEAKFGYQSANGDDVVSRTLYLNKVPLKIFIDTEVDKVLVGEEVEISINVTKRGAVIWEFYWSTILKYENQRSSHRIDSFPNELLQFVERDRGTLNAEVFAFKAGILGRISSGFNVAKDNRDDTLISDENIEDTQELDKTMDNLITDSQPDFFIVEENMPICTIQPVKIGDQVPLRETYRLRPRNSMTFVVSGPVGTTVRFYTERVAFSGGHQHGSAHEPEAIGTCNPQSLVLTGSYPQNMPSEFTAPEGCGIIIHTASFSNGSVIPDRIEVLIPGLVPIAASNNLRLKPPTEVHPSPYWVDPSMNPRLTMLADRYFAERGKFLTVTDASLVWGGRFDLNCDWKRPHAEHQNGRQVDMRSRDMSEDDIAVFRRICREVGLTPVLEGDHWHVRG